jgi:hypothetical protein
MIRFTTGKCYEDELFGKMEISVKDKQLWIKSFRSPKLNVPMYFYNGDIFAINWQLRDMNHDAFAAFSLAEKRQSHFFLN